jgi:hypothetical protein
MAVVITMLIVIIILTIGVVFITRLDSEKIAIQAVQRIADRRDGLRRVSVQHVAVAVPAVLVVAAGVGYFIFTIIGGGAIGISDPVSDYSANNFTKASFVEEFDTQQTYYGYYGDLASDGSTTIGKEEYKLQFSKSTPKVHGALTGDVKIQDRTIHRTWIFEGFHRDNKLVLGFITEGSENDPHPSGIGAYYLEKVDAEYTGTAIYHDCVLRVIVQCPYAMAPDDIGADVAKTRWPKLFNRVCERIDLIPDFSPAPQPPPCA